jgi:copper chaperone CopZ
MKTMMILILFALLQITINSQTTKKSQPETIEFNVNGNCGMCKSRIEKALKVDGVESADWNANSKIVTIIYNKTRIKEAKLHQLIADAGHDTELVSARDEVYNKLHSCCKYERDKMKDGNQRSAEKHKH